MSGFIESTVEQAALAWLGSLGWSVAHGPDIAPDTPPPDLHRGSHPGTHGGLTPTF